MNTRYDWSVGIGRWMGVPLRAHILLILGLIGVFAIDWHYRSGVPVLSTGLVTALVVLFSILLHELAHVWSCLSLGGMVHSVTLTPWGGASHLDLPERPSERLVIHAAGPFANAAVFAICTCLLVGAGQIRIQDLVNPFQPVAFSVPEWETSLIGILGWVNFQLFLFNLLPCAPLDGSRMLRELFVASNPTASALKIEATLMAVAQLASVGLVLMAVVLRDFNDGPVQPVWSIFLAAGVTLMFAARFEYRHQLREVLQSDDWMANGEGDGMDPAGSSSFHDDVWIQGSGSGLTHTPEYSQWLKEKQSQLESGPEEAELPDSESENELADRILVKLHQEGIASLTQVERKFLEDFSRRLREKRSSV